MVFAFVLSGVFSCMAADLTFSRQRSVDYMLAIYFPTCLVTALSWLSFWIRPLDSTSCGLLARLGLGVTCMLILGSLQVKGLAGLPPLNYITVRTQLQLTFMLRCVLTQLYR